MYLSVFHYPVKLGVLILFDCGSDYYQACKPNFRDTLDQLEMFDLLIAMEHLTPSSNTSS